MSWPIPTATSSACSSPRTATGFRRSQADPCGNSPHRVPKYCLSGWHAAQGGALNAQVSVSRVLYRRGAQGLATEGGTPRVDAAKELFASLGGTLECFYFSFGAEDLLVICDLPDNESAAAFSLAINNTGKAKGRVTPLMTPEEMDRATTKAPQYRAPGEP